MRLGRGAKQRQAILVGHEPAGRRADREIGISWQRDAQCLPVQSAIEQAEVASIDVDEDPALVEDREVKRKALNRGCGNAAR